MKNADIDIFKERKSVSRTLPSISASQAVKTLQFERINHIVTVPDWVQLSLHRRLESAEGIRVLNACNENQCVTTAAGLTIAGQKPLLMMQNQGLYNCINTLRAICLDAHIPLVFLVGQFGREYSNIGQDYRQSRRTMVRMMEPLLDALGVPYLRMDTEDDLANVSKAYALAQQHRSACVLLVGAPMAWR